MPREKPLKSSESNKPFIIPVFIPHKGCPHRCAFCNQTTITGATQDLPSAEMLRAMVYDFLGHKKKEQERTVQIAFYGGNFLGLEKKDMMGLLCEAARFVDAGSVDSIRFSTRPDTIDICRLDRIRGFPVSTIELGVQSMNDQVLDMARRGHTAQDTERAASLLHERGYAVGMQMMVGLPGDDDATSLDTAQKIADLGPDFVRIYPTVVLEGSLLAKWHGRGRYVPLPLGRCVTLVKHLCLLFRKRGIPIIRMGLQASGDLEEGVSIVAGPYHPAFGHLVYSEIFLDKVSSVLTDHLSGEDVFIHVHPRSVSQMRGLKNRNIEILRHEFHLGSITIVPDPLVAEGEVRVKG